MKKYRYVAYNQNRKRYTGSFLAENEEDLRTQFARQHLYLESFREAKESSPKARFFSLRSRVTLSELAVFCRQFSVMVNVGVPLVDSLNLLQQQKLSDLMKRVLYLASEDVQSGLMLSEAMARHPKVFPEFFRRMVRVGEISGSLDRVLDNLAAYYEHSAELQKRLRAALRYPLLLFGLTLGLLLLMVLFIIPAFQNALGVMRMELPPLTLKLFAMNDWLLFHWRRILLVLLAAAAFCVGLGRTEKGRCFYDTLLANLPALRRYVSCAAAAKFSRGMGLLLSSGVDLASALDVVANLLGNRYVTRHFREAAADVRQGMSMTMAMDSSRLFPALLVQVLSVGEKSGTLDKLLLTSSVHFDTMLQDALQAITGLIQPVLLLLLGGTVSILFLAVYSPIITIMRNLL